MITESSNLPVDTYYDMESRNYLVQDAYGTWINIGAKDLDLRLQQKGVSATKSKKTAVSPVESIRLKIQHERAVVFAGAIAGWNTGFHLMCGQPVLVTSAPNLPRPVRGKWDVLRTCLEGLYADPKWPQITYYKGWLHHALSSLHGGTFQPGQCLVMSGPSGNGKSWNQWLITQLLGGRSAKPMRYLSGGTTFNRDLIGSEHLTLEDEVSETNIAARRRMGAYIKNTIVNRTQSCHPKHVDSITLAPFWRLSISVNQEHEDLQIVPPINESLDDKMMLLKTTSFKWPMPMDTPRDQDNFKEQCLIELPALTYHLMYEFQVPVELRNARYGITRFQHPAILEVLDDMTPEQRLLYFIDDILFKDGKVSLWEGSSDELKARLEDSGHCREIERLLGYYTATGMMLSKLSVKAPDRVLAAGRKKNIRYWQIRSPRMSEAQPEAVQAADERLITLN